MQWLSKHLDPYIYRKIQYKDKKTRGKAGRGRVAKIFVIRMDSIRSEYIWETPQLESFGDKETRVKWFGHAQKRDSEYTAQGLLTMEVPDKKKRRRPQRSFTGAVEEGMQIVALTENYAKNRVR